MGSEHLYAALAAMEATSLDIVPVEHDLALMAAHIKFELLKETLDIHWLPQR